MTSVEINRTGTDQASIDVFQTGSHESSVSLRHDLLDSKLNYHFAVTSLSVPLTESSIFKLTTREELFRIERRDVGAHVNILLTVGVPGNVVAPVPNLPTGVSIRPVDKHFDVSSFVKRLSNWARGFNEIWTVHGFDPNAGGYQDVVVAPFAPVPNPNVNNLRTLIEVRITADGGLQFVGSNVFWNNFVIRFTREGAAILGFYNQIQEVTRALFFPAPATKYYYIAKTRDAAGNITNDWFNNQNIIIEGGMLQEVAITSDYPLYQSCDQRIKITVETHIPMASNIAIVDEQETADRTIAEAYFESKVENQIKYNESGVVDTMSMTSAMYAGQTNFIRKSDISFQWNKLLTAYEVKLFRFQVYITYRVWNDTTQLWVLLKSPLSVPAQQFWEMSVRFVSDS